MSKGPLVVLGMVQTAGAALVVVGMTAKKTHLVRNEFSLVPAIGPSSAGAVALGSF